MTVFTAFLATGAVAACYHILALVFTNDRRPTIPMSRGPYCNHEAFTMNRFAFACALLCSMFWFASSEAVGPGGQEKISEPAKQAVKQDKKEVVDEKDKAAGEKKAAGVKTGVAATKVMAVPAKAAQKE